MDRSQYFGSVIPRAFAFLFWCTMTTFSESSVSDRSDWKDNIHRDRSEKMLWGATLHTIPGHFLGSCRSTTWHERSHKKVLPQARKATQRPALETIKARTWFTRKLMTGAISCYWLVQKIIGHETMAHKSKYADHCGLITAVYFAPRKWRNPFFNCYLAAQGILVKTSTQQKNTKKTI